MRASICALARFLSDETNERKRKLRQKGNFPHGIYFVKQKKFREVRDPSTALGMTGGRDPSTALGMTEEKERMTK